MSSPDLTTLETLARGAGSLIREGFGRPQQVEKKGAIDLVTEFDHHSETYLLEAIREKFPTHQVITEEAGELQGDPDHCWFIDPLDGTVNYAHGIPVFSVSMAYAREGKVALGVVYDPMREECYIAERGRGAWLNGSTLRVSTNSTLQDSLLVTGFPYDVRSNPENNLDHYSHFSLETQGVRRLGSAALDLCYVAAGRFDGFWEVRINAWDIAAGGLVVEEAGGRVTNLYGDPDYLAPPQSILAANPNVHPLMLAWFRKKVALTK